MRERMLDQCLDRLNRATGFDALAEGLGRGDNNIVVSGSPGGATPALLALIARQAHAARRPLLVVTSSLERAEALTDGAAFFGARPLIFPSFETLPFETVEPALHIAAARNRVLQRLIHTTTDNDPRPTLIIAPADALAFRVLPPERLARQVVRIGWGERLDLEDLAARWVEMGYTREALVESPGEFAVRGSIVDVYPPEAEWPWRLDLFGDELEQIRRFDPATQRSLPAEEASGDGAEIEAIEIHARACHAPKRTAQTDGVELASFFDLLDPRTWLVCDAPSRIAERLIRFDEIAARHWDEVCNAEAREDEAGENADAPDLPDAGPPPTPEGWVQGAEAVERALAAIPQRVDLDPSTAPADVSVHSDRAAIHLGCRSFEAMPAQLNEYLEGFHARLRRGHRVMIVCDNAGQVRRLDELLGEHSLPVVALDDATRARDVPARAEAPGAEIHLCVGELHEGFHCPDAGVCIVTDREIFGRYRRRHIYRKAARGKPVASPTEIHRGDFVVHLEHGIGRFEGVRRQRVDGRLAELLELTYRNGDKLLVPVEKLHLVQKYASPEGREPTVDRLGSKAWARRKSKSMEKVRKMAGELLELYARRAAAQGRAFGDDTTWQQEFEASFIYQETPDQIETIEQVKSDMGRLQPMDRLVCGDVGFGKTEVAIRAVFKCLTEKRQAAVLAPTTLLAQQHERTFRERLADYPFRIDMLSRFRSPKQQRETIQALKRGEVDLLIGTHRLLSRDVIFRDLGLLVVDEEQRFGVAQKEKIKSLRSDVDILTLTATPIPRTLYMSLSGLRDLSVINTPPADRLPIKTRTIRWDREQIEEAILRELNRGGQIYFVHNRIGSIHDVAETIRDIVPGARVAVAHGQMDEHELEQIMIDFIAGQHDILLSTTIIENGLDIPNVNTIIVNRADMFGLAQLYQLRGRVGRDVRQAYAYLIVPKGRAIGSQAVRRLEALEEFTELGMGFAIAMRDLEIRGTGNLLGREQHGAIADVGFEMYCRMLEEATAQLRGAPTTEPLWPTEIKWPTDRFLPEDYIPIESQRIRFYKDVAAARARDDLDLTTEELLDRYGPLPPSAVGLIDARRLKIAAAAWRVDRVRSMPDDSVRVTAPQFAWELLQAMTQHASAGRAVFSRLRRQGSALILDVRDDEDFEPPQILAALADYFEAVAPLAPQPDALPIVPGTVMDDRP